MKQPHIQLDENSSAPCALMPGDPKRVDVIASYLDDVKEIAFNREYRSIIGTYKGMKVIGISVPCRMVSVWEIWSFAKVQSEMTVHQNVISIRSIRRSAIIA